MATAYERTKAWRKNHPDIRAYRAEEARKWRAAHPEKWQEIKARHRENNLEKIRERDREAQRRRRAADPEGQRRRVAEFKARQEARRTEEAGRPRSEICELCGTPGYTVFDHSHSSGLFRGWICDRCNRVLGSVGDSIELLLEMAMYLERSRRGEADG
jgi:hypothetical protein